MCSSFCDLICCLHRIFARFRSLQLLTVETARAPEWIFACLCLHNLLEASNEEFDLTLLEVENVFPANAPNLDRAAARGGAEAAADGDGEEDVVVVAGPRETPKQRRLRVAKEIWNAEYPDNRIA